ncbi:hypothetical protein, partial [Erythrobacter sp. YJ-T3-07]|uniref:hypothetical protein n=1 Tax=Erythrobacter sp. YJ-T3-07 TaxID=2793063 RepID=UPI001F40E1F3
MLQRAVIADTAAQQPLTQWYGENASKDGIQDTAQLDRYIEHVMKEWHAPGLAVSVVQGNTTWAKVGHFLVTYLCTEH